MSTLTKKPVHVSVIDEMGRMLKSAAATGMQHKADALTSIMEAFGRTDGVMRQQGYATNTMKASEAEKLEKVVRRPSLTLVGMSTPSEFMKAIGGGDVASGLLNRLPDREDRYRRPAIAGNHNVHNFRTAEVLGQRSR